MNELNEHVAWVCYVGSQLEVCDSSVGDAFKVYRHPPDTFYFACAEAEQKYSELVDALCSPSWLGRNRHSSVVALAKRLRDSQDKLFANEREFVPMQTRATATTTKRTPYL